MFRENRFKNEPSERFLEKGNDVQHTKGDSEPWWTSLSKGFFLQEKRFK